MLYYILFIHFLPLISWQIYAFFLHFSNSYLTYIISKLNLHFILNLNCPTLREQNKVTIPFIIYLERTLPLTFNVGFPTSPSHTTLSETADSLTFDLQTGTPTYFCWYFRLTRMPWLIVRVLFSVAVQELAMDNKKDDRTKAQQRIILQATHKKEVELFDMKLITEIDKKVSHLFWNKTKCVHRLTVRATNPIVYP